MATTSVSSWLAPTEVCFFNVAEATDPKTLSEINVCLQATTSQLTVVGVSGATVQIKNVTDPVDNQDAATKFYVDSLAGAGVTWKNAVQAATASTATLNGATYAAPDTISGVTSLVVDGVTLQAGDRVLVKDGVAGAGTPDVSNGIYIVGATTTTWTRASDATTSSQASGSAVFSIAGTVNDDVAFVCPTTGGAPNFDPVNFGASIEYTQFSTSGGGPAAPSNSVQFNNGGVFGGTSSFAYDGAVNPLVEIGGAASGSSTATLAVGAGTGVDTSGNINLGDGTGPSTIDSQGSGLFTVESTGGSATFTSVGETTVSTTGAASNVQLTSGAGGAISMDQGTSSIFNFTQGVMTFESITTNNFTYDLGVPTTTGNLSLTLPSDFGENGYLMQTDGAGNTSWINATSITPSLTQSHFFVGDSSNLAADQGDVITFSTATVNGPLFTIGNASSTTVTMNMGTAGTNTNFDMNLASGTGTSSIDAQGTGSFTVESTGGSATFRSVGTTTLSTTGVASNVEITSGVTGDVSMNQGTTAIFNFTQSTIQYESITTNNFTYDLDVPATTGNLSLTLPPNFGTSGYILQTDGAGNTTWIDTTTITPALVQTHMFVGDASNTAADQGDVLTFSTATVNGPLFTIGNAASTTVTLNMGTAGTSTNFNMNMGSGSGTSTLDSQSTGTFTIQASGDSAPIVIDAGDSAAGTGGSVTLTTGSALGANSSGDMFLSLGDNTGATDPSQMVFTLGEDKNIIDADTGNLFLFQAANGNNSGSISNPGFLSRLEDSGEWYATKFRTVSDATVKKNIEVLQDPLNTIRRVEGYSYDWKDSFMPHSTKERNTEFGVVAQQLEEAGLTNLVNTDREGFKTVDYQGLIPILIEALKEVSYQVEDLKNTKNGSEERNKRRRSVKVSKYETKKLETKKSIKTPKKLKPRFKPKTKI